MRRFGHNLLIRGGLRAYALTLPLLGFKCSWFKIKSRDTNENERISFLMRWVFMHIALKGCSPPHTNEPVQFWIGFGLVLIGGSGLNPLGLLTPHWIIQLVIEKKCN